MATDQYKPSDEDRAAIELVRQAVESAERDWHDVFCQKVEKRYGAYRALKQQTAEAESRGWRSAVYQPLLINVIEGMMATMQEPDPSWEVSPLPRPGEVAQVLEDRVLAAEIAEAKLRWDMQQADFPVKQRPFMQQDLIAGYSALKTFRARDKKEIRYLSPKTELEYDPESGSVDVTKGYTEESEVVVMRDGPSFEVRDVRDLFFPGWVTEVSKSPWFCDRVWMTADRLRKLEAQGFYHNVEFALQTEPQRQQMGGREMTLRNIQRSKGLHEVLEFWNETNVITVINRQVLVRKSPNTVFWHGPYPFIITSAMPEMFQIPGVSVIEGLAQMQDMIWTLQNTRLDVVRMLANVPTLIRHDVDNADEFEWAPLARWIVQDPNSVKLLEIDPTVANITMNAEQQLRGDTQQLMGGLPFAAGAESAVVDQTTATGVSIITNIAQAILAARKQQYLWAYEKLGFQCLSIAQQSMREIEAVPDPKRPGGYIDIDPGAIQGQMQVRLRMAAESMVRREERAEWQSLITIALQGAAPTAQMGFMLQVDEFWKGLLRAYDIPDVDRYIQPLPPAPQMGGMPPVGGMGSPPAPSEPSPNGSTNADLAAMGGQTAPTGPEQQLLARAGGGV